MATDKRQINFDQLRTAWSILNEYNDICRIARFRKKLEEQLRSAEIPLTQVPWKSMVRTLLCQMMFSDEQLKDMKTLTGECCNADDIASSAMTIDLLLENKQEDEGSLTETWFEINELMEHFQQALNILGTSRRKRQEILRRILGYPSDYSETEIDFIDSRNDDESIDLAHMLPMNEQNRLETGDLIEFSGNRLHDAFYIYRLPEQGIWAQIQQMWLKHQITDFIFHHSEIHPSDEEEIILIPAMDEYGYGVPYLFATRPSEFLPEGALYKYVDINFPLVARHKDNPTIALIQQHLDERLKNPIYQDKDVGDERSIDVNKFPQEYVACVNINDGPKDNVTWTHCTHYNGKEIAHDLNNNANIFFSRRILEAEEQYRKERSS